MVARQSGTAPVDVGRLSSRPKQPSAMVPRSSTTSTSRPTASARVRSTLIVCGCVSAWTTNRLLADFEVRRAIAIASAAAVASSSSDALARGRPVSSSTIVWKLSSASSRPWLISGWYGV